MHEDSAAYSHLGTNTGVANSNDEILWSLQGQHQTITLLEPRNFLHIKTTHYEVCHQLKPDTATLTISQSQTLPASHDYHLSKARYQILPALPQVKVTH